MEVQHAGGRGRRQGTGASIKESQTRWLNFLSKKVDFLKMPKDNYSSAIDPRGNLAGELKKDNIEIPHYAEITFLRKDRVKDFKFAKQFPHPLDSKNVKNKTLNIVLTSLIIYTVLYCIAKYTNLHQGLEMYEGYKGYGRVGVET